MSTSSRGSEESQDSKTAVNTSAQPSPSEEDFPVRQPEDDILKDADFYDVPTEPVPGWPQVAVLMSRTPEFACFSRFGDFQIKSLLYYQSEIEMLKAELQEEEWEDYRRGDADSKLYCKRADYLVKSRDGVNKRQWEKVVELRKVIKEYSQYIS